MSSIQICIHVKKNKEDTFGSLQPKNEANAQDPKTAVLQMATRGSKSESIPFSLQPGAKTVLVSVANFPLHDNCTLCSLC